MAALRLDQITVPLRTFTLRLSLEVLNVVTLSHNGYIKRLPLSTYRTQHRGGKGVSGGASKEDDWVEHFFVASGGH